MGVSTTHPILSVLLTHSTSGPPVMGWDIVESADKGMKVFTRDNSFFVSVALRIRSSFKLFFHCGSKVLGVVQSTKCFVSKWETACRFSTSRCQTFFVPMIQTLSTSSFASLCYLFHRRTFFVYFKSVIKMSKGFRKWNCFRKTGLNTILIVSIVRTATSVSKMISPKYKFHVL